VLRVFYAALIVLACEEAGIIGAAAGLLPSLGWPPSTENLLFGISWGLSVGTTSAFLATIFSCFEPVQFQRFWKLVLLTSVTTFLLSFITMHVFVSHME
jgi:hypothetical protein